MTNQEKKRYLERYRYAQMEIDRLKEEIYGWDVKACRVTPRNPGTAAGGGGEDRIQCCVDKIVELQNLLTEQLKNLVSLREDVERAISAVEDVRLRQLLKFRYIEGMKWEEIAVKMNYTYRNVIKLHGKALEEMFLEIPT